MSADDVPRYCLIMPFLNEAAHLPAVLASLEGQRFDRERWRLVAVDNGSTDGGDGLVERWFTLGRIAGELVRSRPPSIPRALNRGLECARADEFVVRIDAHTLYAPDYVATIDRSFRELPDDAWCVGAGPEPLAAQAFDKALQVALYTNRFGLGVADFRRPGDAPVPVSTVYLGAFRPGVLQRLGGYDPRWLANEDCELTERIAAAGGLVYRIPLRAQLIVTRGAVATVRKFARYGFWRAQTLKRYPRAIRPRHLAPPLAMLAALLLLASPFRRALAVLYALYALGTIASRAPGERPAVTLGSLLFFPVVHASFGLGLTVGALRTPVALRKAPPGGAVCADP